MTTPVSVTIGSHNDVPVAEVRGEIDLSNVADVRAAIAAAVTNAARGLIVDLSETTYMDSRGVHLLFEIAERLTRGQQHLLVVVPPESPIHRLLTITHFEQAAFITATASDAIARLSLTLPSPPRGEGGGEGGQ
ncbi:MAG TPA: STAS domain-containing protein [bacterium]|jgi:anti-anti-sigma factor|nr:STAS domain-containing protein [bacterium]